MSLKVTRWWWVRHAPVPNMEGVLYGASDVDCDTSNSRAFERLAKVLPKKAFWVMSTLSRTHQTANAIRAAGLKFQTPAIFAGIDEQQFGDWQGLKWSEMEEKDN